MKKKFVSILIILGIFSSAAVFTVYQYENRIVSLLPVSGAENYGLGEALIIFCFSFPFIIIEKCLTFLSATGNIGNGLAFAVLAIISFIPLIPVFRSYKQKEKRLRNFILVLLSPLTAFVLYVFCNNSFLYSLNSAVSAELVDSIKAVFAASVCSGVISVFLIELTEKIRNANGNTVLKFAKATALMLSAFLVFIISVFEFGELVSRIGNLPDAAYVNVLDFIKNLIHYILDIAVISSGIALIDSVLDNKTSDEISYFAHKLSKRCLISLTVIIAVSFLLNFIRIMLSPVVFSEISVKIDIPVFSICFVLMILLISKLVTENKKLREDNDLII